MSIETLNKHIKLLGRTVIDKVTGLSGVIVSISFDLSGCVQLLLQPKVTKDGEVPLSRWLDLPRFKILDDERVMDIPDYNLMHISDGDKGPVDKPTL